MNQTMQIWNWTGKNRIERATAVIPDLKPHDLLLRVRAVGICGTDLHILQDKIRYTTPPLPLGHEIAGEVVACGTAVTQFNLGDRCVVDPLLTCGCCTYCRTGRRQLCPDMTEMGITAVGGWQEYIVVPQNQCYLFPKHLSFAEASQAETLHTVVGGVDRLQPLAGQAALVIGDGPIGLLFAQLLQAVGCQPVTLAGLRPFRLEIAQKLGVERVVDVGKRPLETKPDLHRFPIVVDAVGLPQTIQQAIAHTESGGKLLLFGLPTVESVPINILDIILREITLIGGTNAPHVWQRTIDLIVNRTIKIKELISHTFHFEVLPNAIKQTADCPEETIKVIVEFGETNEISA